MKKALLAVILAATMFATACSTAWVSTFDSILAAAAPALINILEIVAVAEGKPMNTALEAKVNGDAAILKKDAQDYASASAAAAPAACSQLQAAIGVYTQDEADVLALAQVSNPAVQTKITLLSSLVSNTVQAILAVVPSCQAPVSANAFKSSVPLSLKNFRSAYNSILVIPTGNAAVDKLTAKRKLPAHSKFVRVVSLGFAK